MWMNIQIVYDDYVQVGLYLVVKDKGLVSFNYYMKYIVFYFRGIQRKLLVEVGWWMIIIWVIQWKG